MRKTFSWVHTQGWNCWAVRLVLLWETMPSCFSKQLWYLYITGKRVKNSCWCTSVQLFRRINFCYLVGIKWHLTWPTFISPWILSRLSFFSFVRWLCFFCKMPIYVLIFISLWGCFLVLGRNSLCMLTYTLTLCQLDGLSSFLMVSFEEQTFNADFFNLPVLCLKLLCLA